MNGNGSQRAVQVGVNPYADKSSLARYLSPATFVAPAAGTISTMSPRNLAGPSFFQFDMALSRTFQIRERKKLDFRAEAFNVANSLRRGNPVTTLNSNIFGQINTAAGDNRVMQFALKYLF